MGDVSQMGDGVCLSCADIPLLNGSNKDRPVIVSQHDVSFMSSMAFFETTRKGANLTQGRRMTTMAALFRKQQHSACIAP
jgi:hypothetical protein